MVDALNITTDSISSLSGTTSWFSMIITVGICAIVLSVLVMMASNFKLYYKGRKFIDFLISSVYYFFFGIATVACLSVPSLVVYFFITQARKGNTAPLWITGLIILGYIIISLIGWLSKKYIYERVKIFEVKYGSEEQENKDESDR